MKWIAWGPTGAYRQLIESDKAIIPTRLKGEYDGLVRFSDVKFMISENTWFAKVSQWDSFKNMYPPLSIVSLQVGTALQGLVENSISEITLETTMHKLYEQDLDISVADSDRLGALIKILAGDEDGISTIKEIFADCSMEAEVEGFHSITEMVSEKTVDGLIAEEETEYALIAPPQNVLKNNYGSLGRLFFATVRGNPRINLERAVDWIEQAPETQLAKVLSFVAKSDQGEKIAEQISQTAFEKVRKQARVEANTQATSVINIGRMRRSISKITIDDVSALWETGAEKDYTLEHKWAPLLLEDGQQCADLVKLFQYPKGKGESTNDDTLFSANLLWYKLFGIASFISTGRRVEEIYNLWKGRLKSFWLETAKNGFSAWCCAQDYLMGLLEHYMMGIWMRGVGDII